MERASIPPFHSKPPGQYDRSDCSRLGTMSNEARLISRIDGEAYWARHPHSLHGNGNVEDPLNGFPGS